MFSFHKEYFFDRNRDTFESIFDFYLFGKLYPPQGVPEDMYLEEVAFYRMMSVFQHPDENSDCDFIITPKRTGSKFRYVAVCERLNGVCQFS